MLLSALAMPVFAAQTAQMTVKASKTELKPGDTVTFTVSVSKTEKAKMGGFRFVFDETVFVYKDGKSLAGLKGFMAGVSTAADKVAGYFMNGVGKVEGELFSVTMQVRDDAKAGTYTVTGKPSLTDSAGQVECTAVGAEVTVSTAAAAPDKTTPTTPDVSLPSVPVPTLPGTVDVDAPTDSPAPDDSAAPEGAGEPVGTQAPTEENRHVEEAPEKPAFPWWIVAVIAVVAVGGAVFLVLEFRKTKKSQ